jgi:hypothetical protein
MILKSIPDGLLDGLPAEDQEAIQKNIGRPVKVVGFRGDEMEVEFKDDQDEIHTIWVTADHLVA